MYTDEEIKKAKEDFFDSMNDEDFMHNIAKSIAKNISTLPLEIRPSILYLLSTNNPHFPNMLAFTAIINFLLKNSGKDESFENLNKTKNELLEKYSHLENEIDKINSFCNQYAH